MRVKALTVLTVLASASSTLSARLEQRAVQASAIDFSELVRAAKLSSAAYTACFPTAFDVSVTLEINNNATDTQGYVGYSESLQRIGVYMRGSTDPADFANDVNINLTTPVLSGVSFPSGTQVMQGVFGPWSSVHDQVITEVKRLIGLYPTYTLESAGHSLGGSLTYMSYIALAQNFPGKMLISNALAAYPIGNQQFADFGTSQVGLLRRGDNYNDGVPNVYPQFVHYGTEFYGNGTLNTTVKCTGERDLQCSAGNGQIGITLGHLQSFGVAVVGGAGCATPASVRRWSKLPEASKQNVSDTHVSKHNVSSMI